MRSLNEIRWVDFSQNETLADKSSYSPLYIKYGQFLDFLSAGVRLNLKIVYLSIIFFNI